MAATRLIAMHMNKGKTMAKSLHDRLDYSQNPVKTKNGELITAYRCDPATAAEEFLLSKREYLQKTGRVYKGNIIAYQIRQSFKPGEITPEDANKLGYELAMRFTKGEHAFTVSTHTDRAHIHNHIIFNSTDLASEHKFKNFFFSGIALQRLSDIVCFEHGYSIIQKKPMAERSKRTEFPQRHTKRGELESVLHEILKKNPRDMEDVLGELEKQGYVIKRGKHIAVKGRAQQRFIRLDSLEEGFRTEDLILALKNSSPIRNKSQKANDSIDLLIDLQEKIRQGKGAGYQRWVKTFNLKQMAKVLLFLQENDIHDVKDLDARAAEAGKHCESLLTDIKHKEERLEEIRNLKKNIFNYSNTRKIYEDYRKSGYSQKFYEAHRDEITLHKTAKSAFNQLKTKKIPKIADLNAEYSRILMEKKQEYAEYKE